MWTGARISRREGRVNLAVAENIVSLIISGLILWAAVGIFRKVSAVVGTPITNLPLAIGGSLVAALVSYYAAQYKLHVGRETGSVSLVADGYHSRMDTLTTGAVVVGLMGHGIGIELDRIAAVVVALFIVESAVVIAAAAIRRAARRDDLAGRVALLRHADAPGAGGRRTRSSGSGSARCSRAREELVRAARVAAGGSRGTPSRSTVVACGRCPACRSWVRAARAS